MRLAPGAELMAPRPAGGSGPGPSTPARGLPVPPLEQIRASGGLVRARREFERRCIEAALDESGGNVSQAAQWLMVERSNLHKKMQTYGLEARPPRPGGQSDNQKESGS